jgi:hypothetical protein
MAKKKSPTASVQFPLERIERRILLIRDHKIMLYAAYQQRLRVVFVQ